MSRLGEATMAMWRLTTTCRVGPANAIVRLATLVKVCEATWGPGRQWSQWMGYHDIMATYGIWKGYDGVGEHIIEATIFEWVCVKIGYPRIHGWINNFPINMAILGLYLYFRHAQILVKLEIVQSLVVFFDIFCSVWASTIRDWLITSCIELWQWTTYNLYIDSIDVFPNAVPSYAVALGKAPAEYSWGSTSSRRRELRQDLAWSEPDLAVSQLQIWQETWSCHSIAALIDMDWYWLILISSYQSNQATFHIFEEKVACSGTRW